MKKTRKFTGPLAYMRVVKKHQYYSTETKFYERLRIVYQNGDAPTYSTGTEPSDWNQPCWYDEGMTVAQQIKAMKDYDKAHGHKTMFLGEF